MTISERILIAFKAQLKKEFPGWHRFSMTKDQGIVEPCFLIRIRTAKLTKLLMRRYWYTLSVEIVAIPEGKPTHEDLQAIREKMLFALEDFPFGDGRFLRAEDNPETRLLDDAVHFDAQYKLLLEKEEEPGEYMEHTEHILYPDPESYEDAVPKEKDPGMWEWQDHPPYISEEEAGLMEEIENRKDMTP